MDKHHRSIDVTLFGCGLILYGLYVSLIPLIYNVHYANIWLFLYDDGPSIILLISGIGILFLKNWARLTAVIVSVYIMLNMAYNILVLLSYSEPISNLKGTVISFLTAYLAQIFIICFLMRPSVREQFIKIVEKI